MLDILSKGRVDFGVGKGGTAREAGALQADLDEVPAMIEGSARLIPRTWREETFEHRSERIGIPPRPVIPELRPRFR